MKGAVTETISGLNVVNELAPLVNPHATLLTSIWNLQLVAATGWVSSRTTAPRIAAR